MKYLLFLFALVLLIAPTQALVESLPQPVPFGDCAYLPQSDSNSTYQNITYIQKPDQTKQVISKLMQKNGQSYNYTYCDTDELGTYIVNGQGDGEDPVWAYTFEVTPSGKQSDGTNMTLFVIIIVLMYAIGFIGFFGKNEYVSILGGMGMIALGIYTINNGIIIYRDFITDVFSWTTIGIGALFALVAGLEVIQDNY